MEKNNDLMAGTGEKGKWITVNGSHIFIEDGQSVEDAINEQFSKQREKPVEKKGRYTGDHERFNNLYDIWSKHDNLIQKNQYNDAMSCEVEDELRKIGLNKEGILRFWEDINRETIKSTDDVVSVANSLMNDGLYRKGTSYSEDELNEKLTEAKRNSERAKAKLLITEERAKAEGINREAEKEKYYKANQDIEYIQRALKGYNR